MKGLMFSIKQQQFILELFYKKKMLKREQKLYKCNIAFYQTITYLKQGGMIGTKKIEQFNEYFLTEKGKLFGLWLSQLPDNKFIVETLEKQYGKPELVRILDEWFTDKAG